MHDPRQGRVRGHQSPKAFTIALALALSAGAVEAITIDEALAPVRELADKCQPVEGMHPYSSQAATLYQEASVTKMLNFEPVAKQYRSWVCRRKPVTVFVYEFADVAQALKQLRTAQTLIWGGRSPSYHHPERIFALDNLLIVVSGAKPKMVAEAILERADAGGRK